jgi:DNA-directed RNA polymerase specialized sigma24 family protein
VTETELRKAEARYQRASRRAEQLRLERNAAVLAAVEAGWTHARIAEVTGLSRGRINQIAQAAALHWKEQGPGA